MSAPLGNPIPAERRTLVGKTSPLAYAVGAALLLYAFGVGSEWSGNYAVQYGHFALSRGDLALRLNLILLALPASALLALALARAGAQRVLTRFDALERAGRAWPLLVAVAAAVLVAVFRVAVLHETVVTDDENAYAFQARLIETGRLYAPSLPSAVRAFFDNQFIINDGRWYGVYFVGHPAMMALAARLGVARWLGALEAAAVLLLAVGVARRLFGNRVAAVSAALILISPFFLGLFATQLSQTSSVLFCTAALYASVRIDEEPRFIRWWTLFAISLSLAASTRPQTALPYALAVGSPVLIGLVRRRLRPGLAPLCVATTLLLLGVVAMLWVNHVRSGGIFVTGYQAYMAQGIPWSMPVGFRYSVRQVEQALGHLNFWLYGWPMSLAFAPFFERRPGSGRLVSATLLVMIAYAVPAIPTVAPVGPVYYGELIPPLAVLTASGIERTVAWARSRDTRWGAFLAAWPLTLTITALVTFWPAEVASLDRMASLTKLPYEMVEAARLEGAIVFVSKLPGRVYEPGTWAYYHRNPDPDLRDPVLFVRDLGRERDGELMRYLPSRRPYALVFRDGEFKLDPVTR